MKHYFLLPIICATFILTSCSVNQNKNQEISANDTIAENPTADTIIHRFFDGWLTKASNCPDNEMKYLELYDERNKELKALNDSIGFFDNITCVVRGVNYRKYEKQYTLELALYELPDPNEEYITVQGFEMGKVNLYHVGSMSEKDPLFPKTKELQQGDIVYVHGTFVIDQNTGEPRGIKEYLTSAHTLFSLTEYYFNVLEISKKPLQKPDADVFDAIIKGRKAMNYLFKSWRKDKDYRKKTLESLTNEYNESKKNLCDSDTVIVQRYINYMMSDFTRWE